MPHILHKLFEANLRIFANDFKNTAHDVFYDKETGKLIHPGEYGSLRESVIRQFLVNFLPEPFGIGQGFIVSPSGFVSKQCDIIIYSKLHTPIIKTPEHQRFFPIESVLGVIEVKSDITGTALKNAASNLAEIKKARAEISSVVIIYQHPLIGPFEPLINPHDQVATFIFGSKLACGKNAVLETLTDPTIHAHPAFRFNMLCTVDDFCTTYLLENNNAWMYPLTPQGKELPLLFNAPKEGTIGHLKVFFRYLMMIIGETTIIHPELTDYFEKIQETTCEARPISTSPPTPPSSGKTGA